jgi:hypothetical protein
LLSQIGCCASLPLTFPTKRCAQQIFRDDCLITIETTFQYQRSRRNHLSSKPTRAWCLAGAGVSEHLARHHCQAERVIEFVICEQSGIRSDHRSTKMERQFAVEIEPENAIGCAPTSQAGEPCADELALPKSAESSNLSLNKAVIRWMSDYMNRIRPGHA